MGQFKVQRLVNSRAVVSGTDVNGTSGSTVIDTSQWDELNGAGQFAQASKAFDAAVEEFFAPITEAAENLEAAGKNPDEDEATYVVLSEGTDHVVAEPRVVALLSKDSIILRLIEDEQDDRLVWVGDSLEVLKVTDHVTDRGE